MDLKKNWSKLVIAVLSVIGAVVFFIALFDKIDKEATFPAICFDIMGIVFFLGTAVYLVMKMFDMKEKKFVMLGVGVINLILVCIFLFGVVLTIGTVDVTGFEFVLGKKVLGMEIGGIAHTATQIGFVLVAALFPLVKGIKKVFCNKEVATKK